MDKPLYVARKSGFSALRWKLILLFWLVVPLIIQIAKIIRIKTFRLKVYKDRILVKEGLIFTREEAIGLFVGAVRVETFQGFWANLLDFGTVDIQCIGRADLREQGIFDPHGLKRFLQHHFIDASQTQTLLVN